MGLKDASRSTVIVAVAFTLSVFGFLLFIWSSFGGPIPLKAHGYRFQVPFGPEATNLTQNAQARIAGITVGKVVRVSRRRGSVDATIELESRYAPISSDARAIVRQKTLLGESYVELAPGSSRAPKLAENATLPRGNVQEAQQVDDVLSAFDERTRRSFKQTLAGFARALEDRSLNLNAALGNADPATAELDRLMAVLDRQDAATRGLVRDSGRTLTALGRREGALQDLVRSADRVLATTATRDRELTQTVRALPPFLAELRGGLRELDATAVEGGPTIERLRPAARPLRTALERSAVLAPTLEHLLRDLRPAVPELRRALPATTNVLRDARGLMRQLDPAGRELVPVVRFLAAYRNEAVSSLANLAAAAQGSAALPGGGGERMRYVRAMPMVTSEQLFGYADRLPSNRYNPYPPPGAMSRLGREPLRGFDCRHTRNLQTLPVLGAVPPCVEQEPWTFEGRRRSFPRLERFRP